MSPFLRCAFTPSSPWSRFSNEQRGCSEVIVDGTADLAVGLLHLDPSPDALAAVDAMIPWEPRVAHALIDAGVVKP